MAFIKKRFYIQNRQKLFGFLMRELNITQGTAQKLIDTGRVFVKGTAVKDKSLSLCGEIEVLLFEPSSKGLKPIFKTPEFAVFDKPSGLIVHPRNRRTPYSLLDEARAHLGFEANVTHRIDMETSGLLIVSANKEAETEIKRAFEEKKIKKGYLALIKGRLKKELFIDEPIKKNRDFSTIRLKVLIDKQGKKAQTIIKPLEYFNNMTLVEAIPLTGRQHQIRIHLFHVKHPIVGDPIYGVDTDIAIKYLDKKLSEKERIFHTGYKRLMLHANWIEFEYKNRYKIYSKQNFLEECKKAVY
ncbi:RluA family pseudouridine synthase [Nitrosophilus alvini]|uniref:RluA family pseudouridine synthase n=1 Tax=Nitrosophilus alvini TaxID=2714855 RepID=UPI001F165D4D|nr:RluA family pseudouridine synthase [Nitrosophilus alvini]